MSDESLPSSSPTASPPIAVVTLSSGTKIEVWSQGALDTVLRWCESGNANTPSETANCEAFDIVTPRHDPQIPPCPTSEQPITYAPLDSSELGDKAPVGDVLPPPILQQAPEITGMGFADSSVGTCEKFAIYTPRDQSEVFKPPPGRPPEAKRRPLLEDTSWRKLEAEPSSCHNSRVPNMPHQGVSADADSNQQPLGRPPEAPVAEQAAAIDWEPVDTSQSAHEGPLGRPPDFYAELPMRETDPPGAEPQGDSPGADIGSPVSLSEPSNQLVAVTDADPSMVATASGDPSADGSFHPANVEHALRGALWADVEDELEVAPSTQPPAGESRPPRKPERPGAAARKRAEAAPTVKHGVDLQVAADTAGPIETAGAQEVQALQDAARRWERSAASLEAEIADGCAFSPEGRRKFHTLYTFATDNRQRAVDELQEWVHEHRPSAKRKPHRRR